MQHTHKVLGLSFKRATVKQTQVYPEKLWDSRVNISHVTSVVDAAIAPEPRQECS